MLQLPRCDGCQRLLEPKESFYHCLDCSDFDYCEGCFRRLGEGHDHLMSREVLGLSDQWWRQLAWCRSVGQVLFHVLKRYQRRPLFGLEIREAAPSSYEASVGLNDLDVACVDGLRQLPSGGREGAAIHWLTYGGVHKLAKALGAAMGSFLQRGAFVGICAPNSPLWFVVDIACAYYGFRLVPFHPAHDDDFALHVMRESEIQALFCDPSELPRLTELAHKCPQLEHLIAFDEASQPRLIFDVQERFGQGEFPAPEGAMACSALLQKGCLEPMDAQPLSEEELFTLCYTSGSTGPPKGVMFRGTTWRKRFCRPVSISPEIGVCFQPLSFGSARTNAYISLVNGGRLGFPSSPALGDLLDAFQLFRPSFVVSVPRLWNQLYEEYQKALSLARLQHSLSGEAPVGWEAQVMEGFRALLGGRTQLLLSGGAPISGDVLRFLEECYECRVADGYGITETGALTTAGRFHGDARYTLVDAPELGYTTADRPYPRGELWVQTEAMFDGYWKGEAPNEGWFATGDIVEERGEGQLKVIDRKGSVVKLAQGVFVAPEKLETLLGASPLVSQIFVHCEALRSYVVAVVVPNLPVLAAEVLGPQSSPEATARLLSEHREACEAALLRSLSSQAQKAGLQPFEHPRGVWIATQPFTVDNRLLTTTSKLHRMAIAAHFRHELEALYRRIDGRDHRRQLEEILAPLLPGVRRGVGLQELGLDSMAATELRAQVLDRCQVELPLEWLMQNPDIDALTQFLAQPVARESLVIGDGPSALAADLCPSPAWHDLASGGLAAPLPRPGRALLLTGATGFLGPHLLAALERRFPGQPILCLVRADDDAHAQHRLEQACTQQSVKLPSQAVAIAGDLALPRFGWDQGPWASRVRHVGFVLHSGAWVHHLLGYEALRDANLGGTATALALAKASGSAFVLVSSLSAVPPSALHQEAALVPQMASEMEARGGYGQSKFAAEVQVALAREAGVSCQVVRPGYIGAHSVTGAYNSQGTLSRLFRAFLRDRCAPEPEAGTAFSMVCVDDVAADIADICGLAPEASSELPVYNLTHSMGATSWEVIQQGIREAAPEIQWLSRDEWLQRCSSRDPEHPLSSLWDRLRHGLPTSRPYGPLLLRWQAAFPSRAHKAIDPGAVASWLRRIK